MRDGALTLRAAHGDARAWTFTASAAGLCTNSHVIASGDDAAVIDAQFLPSEAGRLADAVDALGLHVRVLYVTHAHPDHYFGLDVLRARWPQARVVALPAVVDEIAATFAAKRAFWSANGYPDPALPTACPVLPESVAAEALDAALRLGELALEVLVFGAAESPLDTAVHVPALAAVVAGDLVYGPCHAWLGEHRPTAWLAALGELARRCPEAQAWLPGHGPGGGRELLAATARYITDVQTAIAACGGDPAVARDTVLTRYPQHALREFLNIAVTRWLAADPARVL